MQNAVLLSEGLRFFIDNLKVEKGRINNGQLTVHNSQFIIVFVIAKDFVGNNYGTNCPFSKYKIAARYVQGTSKIHPRYDEATLRVCSRKPEGSR